MCTHLLFSGCFCEDDEEKRSFEEDVGRWKLAGKPCPGGGVRTNVLEGRVVSDDGAFC